MQPPRHYMGVPFPPPVAIPVRIAPLKHRIYMESRLSSLMDAHDTPGWTINPAFHPEVTAFILSNAHDRAFVERARQLQKNRAAYYAKGGVQSAYRATMLATAKNTVLQGQH